jgi:hypothetical protein
VKEDEMGRECSKHGDKRNACEILMGKPEGKRPLRKSRQTREDNIKMDLQEIEWDSMDWYNLAQDRKRWWALVKTVMNLRVP